MEGFDSGSVYYSDNFGADEPQDGKMQNFQLYKKKFKEFIRQFHEGNFNYKYRYDFNWELILRELLMWSIHESYRFVSRCYLQNCPSLFLALGVSHSVSWLAFKVRHLMIHKIEQVLQKSLL